MVAVASGNQERIVEHYLTALALRRERCAAGLSCSALKKRIEVVTSEMDGASILRRLDLIQERLDLNEALHEEERFGELEARFVDVALDYSSATSISASYWRSHGVPRGVLGRAGFGSRSSSSKSRQAGS